MRKFAISDIHGHAKTFRQLVERRLKLQPGEELYLLGDYIDRGPDSKGVIDYIWELQEAGVEVHCLRGNHEEMMLNAPLGIQDSRNWMFSGGAETMDSFDAIELDDIPGAYWTFLEELEYFHEVDEYILVHAGLNFRDPNPLSKLEDMLWIRGWYNRINYDWLGERVIVHGHTPTSQERIQSGLTNLDHLRYLNIDCGCYLPLRSGRGRLCAFELIERKLYFEENVG